MSDDAEHRGGTVVPFGQRAAAPAAPDVAPDAVPEVVPHEAGTSGESPAPGDVQAPEDVSASDEVPEREGVLASTEQDPAPESIAADADADPERAPIEVSAERAEEIARSVEALLFLSTDPVRAPALADACECEPEELAAALDVMRQEFAPGRRGLVLKEVAGGFTLATSPEAEPAARRLLAKPRTPPLTPAQAETLSIVAYLQPVSRPEITRIRGVSADSASTTLLERGFIEEAGRSPFGAILYRTTPLFLKLFGLRSLGDLPPVTEWDPSPEEEADLRDRLLKAGEARAGTTAVPQPGDDGPPPASAQSTFDDDPPQPA